MRPRLKADRSTPSPRLSPRTLAAVVVLIGLLLVGCESSGGDASPGPSDSETPAPDAAQVALKECLEREGFVATIEPNGSLRVESPSASVTPAEAIEACNRELQATGLVPGAGDGESVEQLTERYEFMLGVRACMIEKGYPTLEPPSLEVFIEDEGGWHPYTAVFGAAANENGLVPRPSVDFDALQRDCPDR